MNLAYHRVLCTEMSVEDMQKGRPSVPNNYIWGSKYQKHVNFFPFLGLFVFFFKMVPLCNPGCPESPCRPQTHRDPPTSAFQVLRFMTGSTTFQPC